MIGLSANISTAQSRRKHKLLFHCVPLPHGESAISIGTCAKIRKIAVMMPIVFDLHIGKLFFFTD
jgi:hypothetical protein